MTLVNPAFERSVDDLVWVPFETPDYTLKRCDMFISSDGQFLKKVREKGFTASLAPEFFNLAFWNALLTAYSEEISSKVTSPLPYFMGDDHIIMARMPGQDMEGLISEESIEEWDMESAMYNIGVLFKIQKNELLYHGEMWPRHILVNGRISMIDLERSFIAQTQDSIELEQRRLKQELERIQGADIEYHVRRGMESVPKIIRVRGVVEKVIEEYGVSAERHFEKKYGGAMER